MYEQSKVPSTMFAVLLISVVNSTYVLFDVKFQARIWQTIPLIDYSRFKSRFASSEVVRTYFVQMFQSPYLPLRFLIRIYWHSSLNCSSTKELKVTHSVEILYNKNYLFAFVYNICPVVNLSREHVEYVITLLHAKLNWKTLKLKLICKIK